MMSATAAPPQSLPALLRGETTTLETWSERSRRGVWAWNLGVIVVGAGLYGAAMGWWRAPLQALYGAIKFPLIILLTTLGNALLNALLAPLLGLNLRFRESLLAILMSFTVASAILGAFSPLLLFLIWNVPPLHPGETISAETYVAIQLTQVAAIAFAGVAGNLRLVRLLERMGGEGLMARKVVVAWLAGNLFLGSQLVWVLRPLIGTPFLPVQFLRPNAWQGSFYETVFRSVVNLFSS